MAYIPMIDADSGEIIHSLVIERGDLRACAEYGGPNPPPGYIRDAHSWCIERARAERRQWRQWRGLPDDSGPGVPFTSYSNSNE